VKKNKSQNIKSIIMPLALKPVDGIACRMDDWTSDEIAGLYLSLLNLGEGTENEKGEVAAPTLFERPKENLMRRRQPSVGYFAADNVRAALADDSMQEMPPDVAIFLDRASELLGVDFNAVCVEKFMSGAVSRPQRPRNWSAGFVKASPFAELALGAERTLRVRDKVGGQRVADISLIEGSLHVFSSEFRARFTGEVVMCKRLKEETFILTFMRHRV
jgi:hypothetical protein